LKKVFLASNGSITRAVNDLSMTSNRLFSDLEARVKKLEEERDPHFHYHLHQYASYQTFTTSTSYTVFCDLPIDRTESEGDYYLVIGVVQVSFPATGVFSLRLTDGTNVFYECVDLARSNHGTEALVAVNKPSKGKKLTYQIEAKRDSGSGNITYVSHAMVAIRGYSNVEVA
jgi:hypothetical protein